MIGPQNLPLSGASLSRRPSVAFHSTPSMGEAGNRVSSGMNGTRAQDVGKARRVLEELAVLPARVGVVVHYGVVEQNLRACPPALQLQQGTHSRVTVLCASSGMREHVLDQGNALQAHNCFN